MSFSYTYIGKRVRANTLTGVLMNTAYDQDHNHSKVCHLVSRSVSLGNKGQAGTTMATDERLSKQLNRVQGKDLQ